jgi:type IV pilus assembly protein PilF
MTSFSLESVSRRSADPFSRTHPTGKVSPARNKVEANPFSFFTRFSLESVSRRSADPTDTAASPSRPRAQTCCSLFLAACASRTHPTGFSRSSMGNDDRCNPQTLGAHQLAPVRRRNAPYSSRCAPREPIAQAVPSGAVVWLKPITFLARVWAAANSAQDLRYWSFFRCAMAAAVCLLLVGGCATEERVKKADGYYQEGMAHLSSDRQKSFVSFQKAIQHNPRHRDAHYSIGHLYVLQGKYKQAEEEFRDAIRIDPNYSEAHNYLGDVLAQEDRWTEAIESYRRALSNPLYSTPDIAWYNMGLAYAHEGDMEKAIQAFEDARVVSPPSLSPAKLNLELGKAYYKLGYNVQAREALSRVTDLDKGGQHAVAADKLLERLKP